jgi:hypothetical protein
MVPSDGGRDQHDRATEPENEAGGKNAEIGGSLGTV